jgi:hypothetical protein
VHRAMTENEAGTMSVSSLLVMPGESQFLANVSLWHPDTWQVSSQNRQREPQAWDLTEDSKTKDRGRHQPGVKIKGKVCY